MHAPLEAFRRVDGDVPNGELVDDGTTGLAGDVIDGPTLDRLTCDAEIQVLVRDANDEPLKLGRAVRMPSAAFTKVVRARDGECRFPGCGAPRHTAVHHVVRWSRGGTTDAGNLVLLCSFHHKLVHEHGWALRRTSSGVVRWIRPDGSKHRAGPSPPSDR